MTLGYHCYDYLISTPAFTSLHLESWSESTDLLLLEADVSR